jgi:hypothetical protein
MKEFIKKIIPKLLLDYNLKRKYLRKNSLFTHKNTKEVFNSIYQQNTWGSTESISGQGSTLNQSKNAVIGINKIIDQYNITSILDLPCGDFNWMKHVNLNSIKYIGADIVEDLIQNNLKKFNTNNIDFKTLNIITDKLDKCDLIIVRDCFVHLSYEDISNSIENIKKSGSKYLLTTTFTDFSLNYNITTGDWRPLNLTKKPFKFASPILIVTESYENKYKHNFRGKSLGLWEIKNL